MHAGNVAELVFGIFGFLALLVSGGIFTKSSISKATIAELRETNQDLRNRNTDLQTQLRELARQVIEIKDQLSSEVAKRELLQDMATGRKDIAELITLLQSRTHFFIDIEEKLDEILRAVSRS